MEERDPHVGVQRRQGVLEGGGPLSTVDHERIHLGLAELAAARADEAAAEPLHAGEPDARTTDVDRRRVVDEHADAGGVHHIADLFGLVDLEVVVAEDGERRYLQTA